MKTSCMYPKKQKLGEEKFNLDFILMQNGNYLVFNYRKNVVFDLFLSVKFR